MRLAPLFARLVPSTLIISGEKHGFEQLANSGGCAGDSVVVGGVASRLPLLVRILRQDRGELSPSEVLTQKTNYISTRSHLQLLKSHTNPKLLVAQAILLADQGRSASNFQQFEG